jgi:hypothetical protein
MAISMTEARVLRLIRRRYEREGYTFIEHPSIADLPSFMEGYRPDALALGDSKTIAIEVNVHRDPSHEDKLLNVAERFKGQSDWEFHVVFGEGLEAERIPRSTIEQISANIAEAEALLAGSHARAAFIIGWAAVEALARTLIDGFPATGSVREAVDSLEHHGRLRFQEAQQLRSLLPLRNKIVHGDFASPIVAAEVETVLNAVRSAFQAA